MEEIEEVGMQREVVNCGAAAGKRVTCNPTNDTHDQRAGVLRSRTAEQPNSRTAKQIRKIQKRRARGEEKRESTVWRWTVDGGLETLAASLFS